MKNVIEIVANELAAQGMVIDILPGSIFEAIEVPMSNDNVVGAITTAISGKMKNELMLIKGKLLPLLTDVEKHMNNKLSEHRDIPDTAKYSIIEFKTPTILNELIDNGTITSKRQPLSLPVSTLSIPTPDKSVIREMFKHNLTSLDKYTANIVKLYTDEDLLKLWDKYLINISKSNTNIDTLGINTIGKLNDIIMLYVAVYNLKDNKPSNVNITIDAYTKHMNFLYLELLNYLAVGIENIALNKRLKKLVLSIRDEYTIVVDSDLYAQLLAEGYTAEAMLGMLLSGDVSTSDMLYDNIKIKADKYIKLWDNKVKLSRMSNVTADIKKYKTLYDIVIRDVYDNILPKDLKEIVVVDKETASIELANILANINASSLLDINHIANIIVANIMFPNTNFSTFTNYMIEYSKLDKTLSASQAASFASFELILDYLLQQVNVRGI